MKTVTHSVSFWELDKDHDNWIPCCDSTQVYSNKTQSGKHSKLNKDDYYCVELKERVEAPSDARNCRRLLKLDYDWSIERSREKAHMTRDELDGFLHHYISFQHGRLKHPHVVKNYYTFSRSLTSTVLLPSCYVADDNGIVLLKYESNKLRCCYMDLKQHRVHHHKFQIACGGNFSNSQTVGVKLCKDALWIFHRTTNNVVSANSGGDNDEGRGARGRTRSLVVIYLRLSDGVRVQEKLACSVHSATVKTLLERIRVSQLSFVLNKHVKYLGFLPEQKKLAVYTFKRFEPFEFIDEVLLLDEKVIFWDKQFRYKDTSHIIYIGALRPEFVIEKKIDFSSTFENYKEFVPSIRELCVLPRGGKLLVMSEESYVIVIDVMKCAVTQILSYVSCFWQHRLSLYISLDGECIRMIGKTKHYTKQGYTDYLCADFPVWHGCTLKEICMHTIMKSYQMNYLRQCNLPKHVIRELEKLQV